MEVDQVRLSASVAHVPDDPWRRRCLAELEEDLGTSGRRLPYSWLLRWHVERDVKRKGCWPTVRAAMRTAHPEATHHLHLAEDMRPCAGFWEELRAAVAAVPDRPVSLMMMGGAPREAAESGRHWIRTRDGLWGGAVVWPTPMIWDFMAWERTYVEPQEGSAGYQHDDGRAAMYLRALGVESFTTAPSLLSHRADAPSVMGKGTSIGGRAKEASYLLGEGDAPGTGQVDWHAGRDDPLSRPSYLGGPSTRFWERASNAMTHRPWQSTLSRVPLHDVSDEWLWHEEVPLG